MEDAGLNKNLGSMLSVAGAELCASMLESSSAHSSPVRERILCSSCSCLSPTKVLICCKR